MIDKKVLRKLLIIVALIIIIILAVFRIRGSLSRYESQAIITGTTDIAFWVVDDTYQYKTLTLVDLYPSEEKFQSQLCSVSNFKEDGTDIKMSDTKMSYYLVLTTTTNLPLSFEVKKDDTENKDQAAFADLIESAKLEVIAKQAIEDDEE